MRHRMSENDTDFMDGIKVALNYAIYKKVIIK